MIQFPNAKINLGLNVVSKRSDGFHNIESVFYPIALKDVLEFTLSDNADTQLFNSGIQVDAPKESNLVYKAYQLLKQDFKLPNLDIYLHKNIPFGAGLGGGSADAAFMLKSLNTNFNLDISDTDLEKYAEKLGSDCVFFIQNKPVYAFEKGTVFEPVQLDLSAYYILLVKPETAVNTAQAYAGLKPKPSDTDIREIIKQAPSEWKNNLKNDFEQSVFLQHPELAQIKAELYKIGAVYASVSGSGSALYGIFDHKPKQHPAFKKYFTFIDKLNVII